MTFWYSRYDALSYKQGNLSLHQTRRFSKCVYMYINAHIPKKSVSRQLTTIGQQLTDVIVNITHVFVNLWLAADKQSTDTILMIYVRMVFIKRFLST